MGINLIELWLGCSSNHHHYHFFFQWKSDLFWITRHLNPHIILIIIRRTINTTDTVLFSFFFIMFFFVIAWNWNCFGFRYYYLHPSSIHSFIRYKTNWISFMMKHQFDPDWFGTCRYHFNLISFFFFFFCYAMICFHIPFLDSFIQQQSLTIFHSIQYLFCLFRHTTHDYSTKI